MPPALTKAVPVLTALALAALVSLPSALAQCPENDYYWVAGSGDWSFPDNWSHEVWDPNQEQCVPVPGVPGSAATAWIMNGGTATVTAGADVHVIGVESSGVTILSGSVTASDAVWVDWGGWLVQSGGDVYLDDLNLGALYPNSSGSYEHTGGTSTIYGDGLWLGFHPGSHGTYELSGSAVLDTSWTVVGNEGTGAFIQTGGTKTTQNLTIANLLGSSGTYELSGTGQIVADQEFVGYIGNGTLTQTGGTNTITAGLTMGNDPGSTGSYDLQDGQLHTAGDDHIGYYGQGTFTQSGGTYAADGHLVLGRFPGGVDTYTMTNGTLTASSTLTIGYSGTGTFTQSSGTNTVTENLTLGAQPGSDGTYELNGDGVLTAGGIGVGGQGAGTFRQMGGASTVTVGILSVGSINSNGLYDLQDGDLTVSGGVYVGDTATGTFTQAGGTHTTGNLYVGNEGDGTATYTLTGGTLTVTTNGVIHVGGNMADGLFTVGPGSPLVDAPALRVGTAAGWGVLDLQSITSTITVGELDFGSNATFTAVPGASVHLNGNGLWNSSTDSDALRGLENLNLICEGDPTYLEVAGYDGGPTSWWCTHNFVIDKLTINGVVKLWDDTDNGNRGGPYGWNEALYINNVLEFGPDGKLYTNDLHVYANCEPLSGDYGGHVCYGSGCGDFDHDCDAGSADFSDFISCLSGPDVTIAPDCNPGDCDADWDVDLTDFAGFQVVFTGD